MVTYSDVVEPVSDDAVFKALADPTRRALLDRLHAGSGVSLTELTEGFTMSRFGIAKHLGVLENAGLVVTRREGRRVLHFLNPTPIRAIHERWLSKYDAQRTQTLIELKSELEEQS